MIKEMKCKYCGGPLIFFMVHEPERVSEYFCTHCKRPGFVDEKGEML